MVIQIWGLPTYPIWKDIILSTQGTTFAALSTADYTVEALTGPAGANAVLLSTGRAVKRPGDTYLQVRVNDIVSDCLKHQDLNFQPDAGTTPGAVFYDGSDEAQAAGGRHNHGAAIPSPALRFRLTWKDPAAQVQNLPVTFAAYADWGGDFSYMHNQDAIVSKLGYILSEPICGNADFRQWVMTTVLDAYGNGESFDLCDWWGLKQLENGGVYARGQFVGVFNGESDAENGPATYFLPLSKDGNRIKNVALSHEYDYRFHWLVEVVENDTRNGEIAGAKHSPTVGTDTQYPHTFHIEDFFHVVESCARYCLYYVNSYGGWDWLLILGKSIETDAAARTTIERRSPSALAAGNVRARGVEVIQAEVTKHLELHTHYLTDFQAARMHNLLNSPDVWVHDLEKNTIYPAVIRDGDCVHKTYKNQDHHLVSYQIDLDYAVTEMRR